MRRRTLAVLFLATAAVVALSAFLLLNGGHQVQAHSLSGATHLELDMIPGNGSGPCNPVDTSTQQHTGDSFAIAVCLTNATAPPSDFNFSFVYDHSLNQCVPAGCSPSDPHCLDSNPDANAGLTTFSVPSLGPSAWDCTVGGLLLPQCDWWNHGIFMSCGTLQPPTLPVGAGISAPIAEVRFVATTAGTDEIVFDYGNSALYTWEGEPILHCDDDNACFGGTVVSVAGVGGKVLLPPAAVADTSGGTSGGAGQAVATWIVLAGVAGALGVGGWHARSRRRSR